MNYDTTDILRNIQTRTASETYEDYWLNRNWIFDNDYNAKRMPLLKTVSSYIDFLGNIK